MATVLRPARPEVRLTGFSSERRSVPDLVDALLEQALARRASDIHLEPGADGMVVRYRVDGMLQQITTIPAADRAAVVSRIKIMANLDIAEHRMPHDGRIRLVQKGRALDLRVSTVPSLHGEKVVLRLLDLDSVAIPLGGCGLAPDHLASLQELTRRTQGTIFMTGPTGSGKTSTIYACLTDIKSETTNIVTIEDPIEYEMDGITQIAVHEKIGLTFAHCLRSVLRQDPDIMLVGEVRDLDTARIAMQASLTGHLVFATLHTNDAVGAITRLADMEIARYLIASSLTAVLAQRLVRRLCPDCKVGYEPDAATRMLLGAGSGPRTLYRPNGCPACHGSGVIGRTAIFELVPITDDLCALISDRGSEAELRACARAEGARSLFQDGVRKVLDGTIALEELKRVAEPDRP
ncbi:MAG: type II secretion system protein GspE [Candidatus Rokuibacteriota bacterium]|nr:MAG: type II secretion system protein GspE [Candidatus Rokubacteria bacterium]